MNSIFLRIYGGMLVAMILVAGMAWGVVKAVNDYREASYNEKMLSGTFWAIANGTSRYHGIERDKWLQLVSAIAGLKLELVPEESIEFDSKERERLREGRVLLRILDKSEPADVYIRLPTEPLYVHTKITHISEQQWRATVVLVLDELGQHPVAEWDAVMANVQQHFGYPVSRVKTADVQLDKDQRERLLKREVVIALSDGPSGDSGIRVYAAIGNTGDVLLLGPVRQLDLRPWSLLVPLGMLGLFLMGLAAYLLVRSLEVRLKKLENAVQQVSVGNLSVRAEVRGSDAVGQLAASFNGMTAHIQRLIQSQREMTRAVSHELRTPVARIRFGLEMLPAISDREERELKVAEIDHDIDQLDRLIDEILTYARLEEGMPVIAWAPVDMAAIAAQVQRELQPMAGPLAIDVNAPEEVLVDGDERYLHRVLQNLVTNAIRYARARIVVHVLVHGQDLELVVEDDGPGIPDGERERVFKPFARLDDSRHRASGGYGLGLSIVQRIAEWHGGRVWVDRAALGGAAFHMRWPLHRAGAHVLARAEDEPVPGRPLTRD
ncbi:MAG: ATP-binding protein [Pseudomonadota bacterium]